MKHVTMRRALYTLPLILLSPLLKPIFGQEQPAPMPHDMEHMQHGGFMQGGMHHQTAKGVKLNVETDTVAHSVTLRIGPMNLPANTSHMKMPQPPDLIWTIDRSGWLLAYHSKLVDASGNAVAGVLLHHVAFWNENRSDFLCPNKEEHIFGAGGELTDWTLIPGFGYRVEKGDQIRIETMIHNPTSRAYEQAYLQVAIPYVDDASPAPVKNFYPAWMDVGGCGNSGYDLPPGPSKKEGSVVVKYGGVLLGMGGHMHDFAQQLVLEDSRAKEPVATLRAKTDDHGRLLSMPVVTFFQTGGYPFAPGDKLTITATYDNTSGKLLRDGAMGIVVGYFVPRDPGAFGALRHAAAAAEHHMAGRSHDH
jgi:hypothetical protein